MKFIEHTESEKDLIKRTRTNVHRKAVGRKKKNDEEKEFPQYHKEQHVLIKAYDLSSGPKIIK